ncbi:unnamed protein product, partial [Allacma fusca]
MFDEPKSTFIGRGALLKETNRRLLLCSTQKTYLQRMVVLTGMPGIGKRHKLNVCEKILGKPEINFEDLKSLVVNTYQYFSDNVRCGLFIFDNAIQMRSSSSCFGIFDFLPKQPLEHLPLILVTSQNIKWGSLRDKIQTIRVEEFSPDESLHFLSNYFPFSEVTVKKLHPQLLTLANLFNGYPLGLDIAASTIADRAGNSLEEIEVEIKRYIHNFNQPNCTWINYSFPDTDASNNVSNLCNVWTPTLEILQQSDAGSVAIELLNIVSYLEPESIIVSLCSAICENERPVLVHGKLEFVDASEEIMQGFNLLQKFSLIQIKKGPSNEVYI